MVRSFAPSTIQDLATDAAAGTTLQEYLESRGIRTPATLALLARDEEDFDRTLIQPLFSGWSKSDGSRLEVPEAEKPIARAMMLQRW